MTFMNSGFSSGERLQKPPSLALQSNDTRLSSVSSRTHFKPSPMLQSSSCTYLPFGPASSVPNAERSIGNDTSTPKIGVSWGLPDDKESFFFPTDDKEFAHRVLQICSVNEEMRSHEDYWSGTFKNASSLGAFSVSKYKTPCEAGKCVEPVLNERDVQILEEHPFCFAALQLRVFAARQYIVCLRDCESRILRAQAPNFNSFSMCGTREFSFYRGAASEDGTVSYSEGGDDSRDSTHPGRFFRPCGTTENACFQRYSCFTGSSEWPRFMDIPMDINASPGQSPELLCFPPSTSREAVFLATTTGAPHEGESAGDGFGGFPSFESSTVGESTPSQSAFTACPTGDPSSTAGHRHYTPRIFPVTPRPVEILARLLVPDPLLLWDISQHRRSISSGNVQMPPHGTGIGHLSAVDIFDGLRASSARRASTKSTCSGGVSGATSVHQTMRTPAMRPRSSSGRSSPGNPGLRWQETNGSFTQGNLEQEHLSFFSIPRIYMNEMLNPRFNIDIGPTPAISQVNNGKLLLAEFLSAVDCPPPARGERLDTNSEDTHAVPGSWRNLGNMRNENINDMGFLTHMGGTIVARCAIYSFDFKDVHEEHFVQISEQSSVLYTTEELETVLSRTEAAHPHGQMTPMSRVLFFIPNDYLEEDIFLIIKLYRPLPAELRSCTPESHRGRADELGNSPRGADSETVCSQLSSANSVIADKEATLQFIGWTSVCVSDSTCETELESLGDQAATMLFTSPADGGISMETVMRMLRPGATKLTRGSVGRIDMRIRFTVVKPEDLRYIAIDTVQEDHATLVRMRHQPAGSSIPSSSIESSDCALGSLGASGQLPFMSTVSSSPYCTHKEMLCSCCFSSCPLSILNSGYFTSFRHVLYIRLKKIVIKNISELLTAEELVPFSTGPSTGGVSSEISVRAQLPSGGSQKVLGNLLLQISLRLNDNCLLNAEEEGLGEYCLYGTPLSGSFYVNSYWLPISAVASSPEGYATISLLEEECKIQLPIYLTSSQHILFTLWALTPGTHSRGSANLTPCSHPCALDFAPHASESGGTRNLKRRTHPNFTLRRVGYSVSRVMDECGTIPYMSGIDIPLLLAGSESSIGVNYLRAFPTLTTTPNADIRNRHCVRWANDGGGVLHLSLLGKSTVNGMGGEIGIALAMVEGILPTAVRDDGLYRSSGKTLLSSVKPLFPFCPCHDNDSSELNAPSSNGERTALYRSSTSDGEHPSPRVNLEVNALSVSFTGNGVEGATDAGINDNIKIQMQYFDTAPLPSLVSLLPAIFMYHLMVIGSRNSLINIDARITALISLLNIVSQVQTFDAESAVVYRPAATLTQRLRRSMSAENVAHESVLTLDRQNHQSQAAVEREGSVNSSAEENIGLADSSNSKRPTSFAPSQVMAGVLDTDETIEGLGEPAENSIMVEETVFFVHNILYAMVENSLLLNGEDMIKNKRESSFNKLPEKDLLPVFFPFAEAVAEVWLAVLREESSILISGTPCLSHKTSRQTSVSHGTSPRTSFSGASGSLGRSERQKNTILFRRYSWLLFDLILRSLYIRIPTGQEGEEKNAPPDSFFDVLSELVNLHVGAAVRASKGKEIARTFTFLRQLILSCSAEKVVPVIRSAFRAIKSHNNISTVGGGDNSFNSNTSGGSGSVNEFDELAKNSHGGSSLLHPAKIMESSTDKAQTSKIVLTAVRALMKDFELLFLLDDRPPPPNMCCRPEVAFLTQLTLEALLPLLLDSDHSIRIHTVNFIYDHCKSLSSCTLLSVDAIRALAGIMHEFVFFLAHNWFFYSQLCTRERERVGASISVKQRGLLSEQKKMCSITLWALFHGGHDHLKRLIRRLAPEGTSAVSITSLADPEVHNDENVLFGGGTRTLSSVTLSRQPRRRWGSPSLQPSLDVTPLRTLTGFLQICLLQQEVFRNKEPSVIVQGGDFSVPSTQHSSTDEVDRHGSNTSDRGGVDRAQADTRLITFVTLVVSTVVSELFAQHWQLICSLCFDGANDKSLKLVLLLLKSLVAEDSSHFASYAGTIAFQEALTAILPELVALDASEDVIGSDYLPGVVQLLLHLMTRYPLAVRATGAEMAAQLIYRICLTPNGVGKVKKLFGNSVIPTCTGRSRAPMLNPLQVIKDGKKLDAANSMVIYLLDSWQFATRFLYALEVQPSKRVHTRQSSSRGGSSSPWSPNERFVSSTSTCAEVQRAMQSIRKRGIIEDSFCDTQKLSFLFHCPSITEFLQRYNVALQRRTASAERYRTLRWQQIASTYDTKLVARQIVDFRQGRCDTIMLQPALNHTALFPEFFDGASPKSILTSDGSPLTDASKPLSSGAGEASSACAAEAPREQRSDMVPMVAGEPAELSDTVTSTQLLSTSGGDCQPSSAPANPKGGERSGTCPVQISRPSVSEVAAFTGLNTWHLTALLLNRLNDNAAMDYSCVRMDVYRRIALTLINLGAISQAFKTLHQMKEMLLLKGEISEAALTLTLLAAIGFLVTEMYYEIHGKFATRPLMPYNILTHVLWQDYLRIFPSLNILLPAAEMYTLVRDIGTCFPTDSVFTIEGQIRTLREAGDLLLQSTYYEVAILVFLLSAQYARAVSNFDDAAALHGAISHCYLGMTAHVRSAPTPHREPTGLGITNGGAGADFNWVHQAYYYSDAKGAQEGQWGQAVSKGNSGLISGRQLNRYYAVYARMRVAPHAHHDNMDSVQARLFNSAIYPDEVGIPAQKPVFSEAGSNAQGSAASTNWLNRTQPAVGMRTSPGSPCATMPPQEGSAFGFMRASTPTPQANEATGINSASRRSEDTKHYYVRSLLNINPLRLTMRPNTLTYPVYQIFKVPVSVDIAEFQKEIMGGIQSYFDDPFTVVPCDNWSMSLNSCERSECDLLCETCNVSTRSGGAGGTLRNGGSFVYEVAQTTIGAEQSIPGTQRGSHSANTSAADASSDLASPPECLVTVEEVRPYLDTTQQQHLFQYQLEVPAVIDKLIFINTFSSSSVAWRPRVLTPEGATAGAAGPLRDECYRGPREIYLFPSLPPTDPNFDLDPADIFIEYRLFHLRMAFPCTTSNVRVHSPPPELMYESAINTALRIINAEQRFLEGGPLDPITGLRPVPVSNDRSDSGPSEYALANLAAAEARGQGGISGLTVLYEALTPMGIQPPGRYYELVMRRWCVPHEKTSSHDQDDSISQSKEGSPHKTESKMSQVASEDVKGKRPLVAKAQVLLLRVALSNFAKVCKHKKATAIPSCTLWEFPDIILQCQDAVSKLETYIMT